LLAAEEPVKFAHFAWSWLRYKYWKLRGWKLTVPQKIADQRFSECEACEHFQDGECQLCGCLAQAKVILASEKCPRGFWMTVKIPDDKKPL
jgi:hypothetical protein